VEVMEQYRKEWTEAMEQGSGGFAVCHIEKLQGDLVFLKEEFEEVVAQRAGPKKEDVFTRARIKFMQEAEECTELLKEQSTTFARHPQKAFVVYDRYDRAVDSVFSALSTEFPEEAKVEEKELQEFLKFSRLQDTEKEGSAASASMKTIQFASKLLRHARPEHVNELNVGTPVTMAVHKSLSSIGSGSSVNLSMGLI